MGTGLGKEGLCLLESGEQLVRWGEMQGGQEHSRQGEQHV